jgi:hypothetical protein
MYTKMHIRNNVLISGNTLFPGGAGYHSFWCIYSYSYSDNINITVIILLFVSPSQSVRLAVILCVLVLAHNNTVTTSCYLHLMEV